MVILASIAAIMFAWVAPPVERRDSVPQDVVTAIDAQDYARARALLEPIAQACQSRREPSNRCLDLLLLLSMARMQSYELAGADEAATRALALAIKTRNKVGIADSLWMRGKIALSGERMDDAEAHLRRAIETYRDIGASGTPSRVRVEIDLVTVMIFQLRLGEAEAAANWIVRNTGVPALTGQRLTAQAQLAMILVAQRRYDEAITKYSAIVDSVSAGFGAQHREMIAPLHDLGWAQLVAGRIADAERSMARALGLARHHWPRQHPVFRTVLGNYGYTLAKLGRCREADPLLREARALTPVNVQDIVAVTIDLSLAECLSLHAATRTEARRLYQSGQRFALNRLGRKGGFTTLASIEFVNYRSLFTGNVEVAWQLANQGHIKLH